MALMFESSVSHLVANWQHEECSRVEIVDVTACHFLFAFGAAIGITILLCWYYYVYGIIIVFVHINIVTLSILGI